MLRSYVDENQRLWDKNLTELQYALRSYVHEATGHTAYQLVFGYPPILDGRLRPVQDVLPDQDLPSCVPRGEAPISDVLKPLWESTKKKMLKAYTKNAHSYNLRRRPVHLAVGQIVYRRNFQKSDASKGISSKLLPKFLGPYSVSSSCGQLGYMLTAEDGKTSGPWHVEDLKIVNGRDVSFPFSIP